MNKYTPSLKIEMARYFLKHPNETQSSIAHKFGVSRDTLTKALNYYLRVIDVRLKPMGCASIDRMDMHKDDSKRFENLISYVEA